MRWGQIHKWYLGSYDNYYVTANNIEGQVHNWYLGEVANNELIVYKTLK